MSYPKTKEEWIDLCSTNWNDIWEIIFTYAPDDATKAELAYESQDWHTLCRVMNKAWWYAPDTYGLHGIPGWLEMCDLCSEEYVLYDEQMFSSNDEIREG